MKTMNEKYRILLLDTKDRNPNHYILIAIESALRKHPAVEGVWSAEYSDALNVAIRSRCNLFIAWEGESLDRGLCQRLAMTCGRSVLWVTEDPYDIRDNLANSSLFDLVFTNDSGSLSDYPPGKAYHLPLASHPEFQYHEIPERDGRHYLYDLLFVGSAWPNRVALLKTLLPNLKGMKMKVALSHNEFIPVPDLPLPESACLWKTPNSELARMANRSRVTLTLHRDFSGSGNRSAARTPGPRLFETALAGGFQLVDLNLPEVDRYFTSGKEIGSFRSVEDCLTSIRYYLDHPEERLSMARAAQQRCLSEHLYRHRIDRILETVNSLDAVATEPVKAISQERKFRILHLLNDSLGVYSPDGDEACAGFLVRNLPDNYESYLYYPDLRGPNRKEMILWDVRRDYLERIPFTSRFDSQVLYDQEKEDRLARILHENRIDLVHVHPLFRHPWSLPLVPRTLGIPVVMTLPCVRDGDIEVMTCDACFPHQEGEAFGSRSERRNYIGGVVENVDSIIVFRQVQATQTPFDCPVFRKNPDGVVEGSAIDKPAAQKLVMGVYARLLDEYGIGARGDSFFREYPAPRAASASNIFRKIPVIDLVQIKEQRIHHLEEQIHQMEEQIHQMEEQTQRLHRSKSWRITKPLRSLEGIFRKWNG